MKMIVFVFISKPKAKKLKLYTNKSTFMVTKVKELNNIRPGLGAADLALVLQDNETRESKIDKRLKFGGLKGSTK